MNHRISFRRQRRNFLIRSASLFSLAVPSLSTAAGLEPGKIQTDARRILFQGDSITDGNRGRNDDPNHILGHGYAFAVAAELGSRLPERNLHFINKGVSGDKISDLLARWKTDALDLKPDLISILVGINDIHDAIRRNTSFNNGIFAAQYRELLDRTYTAIAGVKIVIGEPFVLPVGMVANMPEKWTGLILSAQESAKQIAAEYRAVFVPYQKMFNDACAKAAPEYWIWDGIHPTYAGHGLMKELWLKEVVKNVDYLR